jgi:hypothetical protein
MKNNDCGCNGPKLALREGYENILISEGLKYHIVEGIPLYENIYRPQSDSFLSLFVEARQLYENGLLGLTEQDSYYFENSDLGKFGIYEGMKVPLDYPMSLEYLNEVLEEKQKTKKKHPPLNKPHRGGAKKFYVYVRKPGGGIKKVSFGQVGMSAKINNPVARRAFSKRHNCPQKKDKTKASYWSCRLPRYSSLLGLKSNFSGYW